jgi:hypothetical protein
LGVTQIPNPTYATIIVIASQIALQAAIAHHGTMPNNLDSILTSVNHFSQQFIVITTNIPPTIDALAFAYRVGELFQVLELKFSVKNFEFFL